MSSEERKKWEEKSDKDRLRYDVEKVIYKGKWTVPHAGKRSKKDKMAPKRPMSAFLDFSKTFRTEVIRDNPQATNNREISKILGSMWRNASTENKRYFIEKEARLRAEYNEDMSKWRKAKEDELAAKIRLREAAVRDAIDHGTVDSLVKAAEVSQQTLFNTDSVAAYEEPHESNVQHALPHDYSRYPSYHSTAFGHTYYQPELSSMPESSARYRQSPGCSIPTTSNNSSYNSGYYVQEKYYSHEGPSTYQEQSLPHYTERTVTSEQDPRLSNSGWNCFQPSGGGRWENGPTTPHSNSANYATKPHGYLHVPYYDVNRVNFNHSSAARSSGGWGRSDKEWFSWD
jgi:high mobility group protein B1